MRTAEAALRQQDGLGASNHSVPTEQEPAVTDKPDAAAAIVWLEKARHADDLARQAHAYANAIMDTPDPDVEHVDHRVRIYGLAVKIAETYEFRADLCRERAADAKSLRRTFDNTITVHDIAEQITRGGAA